MTDIERAAELYRAQLEGMVARHGDDWRNGEMGKFVQRFLTYPEGEKALASFARHNIAWHSEKPNPDAWRKTGPILFEMFIHQVWDWLIDARFRTHNTAKQREEILDRIVVTASNLKEDLRRLDISPNLSQYFTNEELFVQYTLLFQMFDIHDALEDSQYIDFRKQIREYCAWNWGDYRLGIGDIQAVLHKLTNRELLVSLMGPEVVGKPNSPNLERIYLIRMIHERFMEMFGTPLHETVANICAVVFDDPGIDREIVRSALAGYQIGERSRWKSLNPGGYISEGFVSAIDEHTSARILGGKKEPES